VPKEFPKRTITFQSNRDVMFPSDRFLPTDKDNVFGSFKWAKQDKMVLFHRQKLTFEWEDDRGLKFTAQAKTEQNEAVGNHHYYTLKQVEDMGGFTTNSGEWYTNGKVRTTELFAELRIAPGEKYVNTKLRRVKVNYDNPVFTISHTWGVKGLLGGQYNYHYSQLGIYNRFWLNSWGHIDLDVNSGIVWSKVPYPMLVTPPANLSYIMQKGMYNLVNNMEFINDRYVTAFATWNLNGKLLNRIPIIKHLQLREIFSVKCLWGALSPKNNPNLSRNAGSDYLMPLPYGCYVMDGKRPYVEISAGIHNIFKFLHVEWVRRLNYNDLPTATKWGIRFFIEPSF